MIKRSWIVCVMLALAACANRLPPPPSSQPSPSTPPLPQAQPSPGAQPSTVADLAQAIDALAKRSDHEPDSKIREQLAIEAGHDAQDCLAQQPQAAACLYGHAVALGLMARTHPTRAGEFLTSMLDALAKAETVDPAYQDAGPARVRALVLIRAPGWPLGPGDPEAGLAAARRAVALSALYPPNLLALAEALAKSGDAAAAKLNYSRARDAALALPAGSDRDDWVRQAGQGLQHQ